MASDLYSYMYETNADPHTNLYREQKGGNTTAKAHKNQHWGRYKTRCVILSTERSHRGPVQDA